MSLRLVLVIVLVMIMFIVYVCAASSPSSSSSPPSSSSSLSSGALRGRTQMLLVRMIFGRGWSALTEAIVIVRLGEHQHDEVVAIDFDADYFCYDVCNALCIASQ